ADLDKARTVKVVAAGVLVPVRGPVDEEDGAGGAVLLRKGLPAAFGGLYRVASHVPVLRQREHLRRGGRDGRRPEVEQRAAAEIPDLLIRVRVLVRGLRSRRRLSCQRDLSGA